MKEISTLFDKIAILELLNNLISTRLAVKSENCRQINKYLRPCSGCEHHNVCSVRFWHAVHSTLSLVQHDAVLQVTPPALLDIFVQSFVLLSAAVSFAGSPTVLSVLDLLYNDAPRKLLRRNYC